MSSRQVRSATWRIRTLSSTIIFALYTTPVLFLSGSKNAVPPDSKRRSFLYRTNKQVLYFSDTIQGSKYSSRLCLLLWLLDHACYKTPRFGRIGDQTKDMAHVIRALATLPPASCSTVGSFNLRSRRLYIF